MNAVLSTFPAFSCSTGVVSRKLQISLAVFCHGRLEPDDHRASIATTAFYAFAVRDGQIQYLCLTLLDAWQIFVAGNTFYSEYHSTAKLMGNVRWCWKVPNTRRIGHMNSRYRLEVRAVDAGKRTAGALEGVSRAEGST